ncbi:hypothetical protein HOE22_03675 [Candidatus Woesearchaeota archaeon]|jgi:hypothetical protein|nr:hypothetical protein [Candidatus Woesearchaeota archaeon]MBT7556017.1 hypothetical protein [Candidatus Woesearchaeota archaeon]
MLYRASGKLTQAEAVKLKPDVFHGDVGVWKPNEVDDMMSKLRNRPFDY